MGSLRASQVPAGQILRSLNQMIELLEQDVTSV